MKTVTSHQLVGVLSANKRRARAKTSSPGISSTSPDSTSAILRLTSASCALVISGETSSARLPINRQFRPHVGRECHRFTKDFFGCGHAERLRFADVV